MNIRKTILIADAHVSEASDAEEAFFNMLEKIGKTDCHVVFLGDIFELWVGFDAYESAHHRRFLEWAANEKKKRNIGFIEGNHEFYIREQHADAFTWVTDFSHYLSDGHVCLMHGDTINEADRLYLLFRMFLRNPITRFLVWIFGPFFGRFLSEKIRLSLKSKNMKHKKVFPEKYICSLAGTMEEEGVDLCVLGHFHSVRHLDSVCVLPAWTPDGEVGIFNPENNTVQIRNWNKFLSSGDPVT